MKLLKVTPNKRVSLVMLITGFIVFIPFYSYNLLLVASVMDIETLQKMLLSFSIDTFSEVLRGIEQAGNLGRLAAIYYVNIVSTSALCVALFALMLFIARALSGKKMLEKIAYIMPFLVFAIGVLDILPSIMYILLSYKRLPVSVPVVYMIDASYMLRLFILYAVILWLAAMGLFLAIRRLKNKGKP